MTDLQGRDLDRAIAEAMGGEECDTCVGWMGLFTDLDCHPLPAFHLSLDALSSGPEKVLRDAGLELNVEFNKVSGWHAWQVQFRATNTGIGVTEAEARARAVLAALRAMKEGGGVSELTITLEVQEILVRMSRKEAEQLAAIIHQHGTYEELNRFGRVLREVLKPRTDYAESRP